MPLVEQGGYIPELDQTKYPRFDSTDRIAPKNLITYGFISTFTSRSQGPVPSGEQIDPALNRVYNQFGRFKLEHTYDIIKAQENHPE